MLIIKHIICDNQQQPFFFLSASFYFFNVNLPPTYCPPVFFLLAFKSNCSAIEVNNYYIISNLR